MKNTSVIGSYSEFAKSATELNMENELALATVIRVASMHQVADYYGPIAYSTTGSLTNTYDPLDIVYEQFFNELDSSIDILEKVAASGGKLMEDYDLVYNGDASKWVKFANSLRLRLAMRISNPAPNGDPVKARKVVEEVFADEAMTMDSDSDVALSHWGGLISAEGGDYNPLYYYAVYEKEKNKGTLPAFGETACYHMKPYGDPRLAVYAQPVVQKKIADGTTPVHAGEYFGDTASYGGYGGDSGISAPGEKIHSAMTREDYSPIGEWFLKPDAEFVFLSYAEVCFLKAEAKLRG
jgi:hypothetical protein